MTDSSQKPLSVASNTVIYGALALGLLTAIAFRLLIVLDHVEPGWVRPTWYFGVLGNFVFFYYRYRVTQKRKRVIRKNSLIQAIETGDNLSVQQREALVYLLQSIRRSPESINYLIISIFSVVAIAMDLVITYVM